jgi:hypothetical protein
MRDEFNRSARKRRNVLFGRRTARERFRRKIATMERAAKSSIEVFDLALRSRSRPTSLIIVSRFVVPKDYMMTDRVTNLFSKTYTATLDCVTFEPSHMAGPSDD